jgi:hypothetical protein
MEQQHTVVLTEHHKEYCWVKSGCLHLRISATITSAAAAAAAAAECLLTAATAADSLLFAAPCIVPLHAT